MAWNSKKSAENELNRRAGKVTEADVVKVLEKEQAITRKFRKDGPLGKFMGDLRLFFDLLKSYWRKEYRKVPFWTIAAIVAALLYVLNPFDLVPDFIPFIGLVDDALVVSACLSMIKKDLIAFEEWRMETVSQIESEPDTEL